MSGSSLSVCTCVSPGLGSSLSSVTVGKLGKTWQVTDGFSDCRILVSHVEFEGLELKPSMWTCP